MNSKELVKALKPFERERVVVFVGGDRMCTFNVFEVMPLPPILRREVNIGNVMLHAGTYDREGYPEGVTLTARNVAELLWMDEDTCLLRSKDGVLVRIVISRPSKYRWRGEDGQVSD